MTVCIAALCTWPDDGSLMIVGASDRMLSAPDIKFEPPQMKIYRFSDKVIALIAGDPYAQMAICYETSRAIDARKQAKRKTDTVADIAGLFGDAFSKYRREKAENRCLKTVGLDVAEFLNRHSEWDANFVAQVTSELKHATLDAEAIIAGCDETGFHIYIVDDPGDVRCADAIGFASIGTGKNHADSQFMLARHSQHTSFHTALLQVYAAKKRAEIAPTVGLDTDYFYIGNEGAKDLNETLIASVGRAYNALEQKISDARVEADREVYLYLVEHLNAARQPQSTSDNADNADNATVIPTAEKAKKRKKANPAN